MEKQLGKYIKELRQNNCLTIKELSYKIGIDGSQWSRIEHDKRSLSIGLVPALAKVLAVDFRSLQTIVLAKTILSEFGNEEYCSEGIKQALKEIE